jgi:hypothetical protein
MTFISDVFFVFVVILTIQVPPKYILCFCALDTVKDESIMVFDASVVDTAKDDSDLILNGVKQPSNIHAFSTQLSSEKVTHSGMNQMTAPVS